jgi:arylsulfatase A-like enzyme
MKTTAMGAGISLLPKTVSTGDRQTNRRRPNLVFIFSDQQSHDMLGCSGNEQLKTPHLDRFAQQSVRFTHCVSQYSICTLYRSMLLSGNGKNHCPDQRHSP